MDFESDFEDYYFKTKYGKMHYKHHVGKGKTIVFLHGFATDSTSWARLVNYVPSSLNIYLIDLLGHGKSDAPDIDYSLQTNYRTVKDFIKKKVGVMPVLFGHSYGGWIAAYYASKNKVKGLILEDSAGLRQFNEERHRINPEYREELIKSGLEVNKKMHVLRSMLHSDNSKAQLDEKVLAKINCKCAVVWGSEDSTINPKYAVKFNNEIKNSTLAMINGARHTPHYSKPKDVAKVISDFIK